MDRLLTGQIVLSLGQKNALTQQSITLNVTVCEGLAKTSLAVNRNEWIFCSCRRQEVSPFAGHCTEKGAWAGVADTPQIRIPERDMLLVLSLHAGSWEPYFLRASWNTHKNACFTKWFSPINQLTSYQQTQF